MMDEFLENNGNRIRVFHPMALQELTSTGSTNQSPSKQSQNDHHKKKNEEMERLMQERREQKILMMQEEQREALQRKDAVRQELQKKMVEKKAQEEEEKFKKMYSDLLQERQEFVHGRLDNFFSTQQRVHHQKIRGMHFKWSDKIFNKISEDVNTKVDGMSHEEIISKHTRATKAFLDASNKRGGALFLDVVIENEYNPTAELHPVNYKKPSDDADPLLANESKAKREKSLQGGGSGGRGQVEVPLGRPDCLHPLQYPTLETMNRHTEKMLSKKGTSKRTESRVTQDHFLTYDEKTADEEFNAVRKSGVNMFKKPLEKKNERIPQPIHKLRP